MKKGLKEICKTLTYEQKRISIKRNYVKEPNGNSEAEKYDN